MKPVIVEEVRALKVGDWVWFIQAWTALQE